jgi:hypothetical protein
MEWKTTLSPEDEQLEFSARRSCITNVLVAGLDRTGLEITNERALAQ